MAPAEPTHYDVLGVDPGATAAEIRRAYLRLARDHHPDFHTNAPPSLRAANEREMQRINEAWAAVGDPERRRAYDRRRQQDDPDPATTRTGPRPADYDFRPYDTGPDVDYAALLDDTPVAGTSVSRALQVLPAVVLLAGAAVFVVGGVIQAPPLLALGIIGVVLGLLGFLAAPAMAVARSIQAERDP